MPQQVPYAAGSLAAGDVIRKAGHNSAERSRRSEQENLA